LNGGVACCRAGGSRQRLRKTGQKTLEEDAMTEFVPWIWVAGGLQLLIASANIVLPKKLAYRENLSRVSPIVRQVFIVHSVYIVLLLVAFALLCFLFASELAGASGIGRFLSGLLAVFWLLRAVIQIFYYDPEVKAGNPAAHVAFSLAVTFLGGLFLIVALGG
jgi:hypothetical protein